MADGFDDDELVKKLEKISENEFNDVIAREKTHANELAKYKAAAADRMSTAAITIGFFAPASAIVLNPGQMMDLNSGQPCWCQLRH